MVGNLVDVNDTQARVELSALVKTIAVPVAEVAEHSGFGDLAREMLTMNKAARTLAARRPCTDRGWTARRPGCMWVRESVLVCVSYFECVYFHICLFVSPLYTHHYTHILPSPPTHHYTHTGMTPSISIRAGQSQQQGQPHPETSGHPRQKCSREVRVV